ncbi:MAG: NAD(P)/FAD-dependent oxidoreductase [Thermoanaerobaculia bacterium]
MRSPAREADVVVVGGGAAGLRAASLLGGRGLDVVVIEARERLGGRILTVADPDWPVPIELGAEWIHGEASETMSVFDESEAVDVPDEHLLSREDGSLDTLSNFWERLARIRDFVPDQREATVAEALGEFAEREPNAARLARSFVEGFEAADPAKMSGRALSFGDDGAMRQRRPAPGYDTLVQRLERRIASQGEEIHVGAAVERIEWSRGRVLVRYRQGGEAREIHGRTVVITVPLPILRTLEIDPPIESIDLAFASLHMGEVVKMLLRFRTPFWENRFGRQMAFLHDPGARFHTWWTTAPLRAAVLVAWCGGPKAASLAAMSETSRLGIALDELATLLGVERSELDERFVDWRHHDWSADPWSRGAYSYPGIGGEAARHALTAPVEETIFFAGEALSEKNYGTVEGALETGRRAAEAVVASGL